MTDEDVIYFLYSELVYRLSQTECKCGHPSCSKCDDDRDTRAAIRLAESQWPTISEMTNTDPVDFAHLFLVAAVYALAVTSALLIMWGRMA